MIYNQVFRFKICAGLPVATPEWEFKINANAFRIKKCLYMGCFMAAYYHISFGCQEHNPYCQHQLRGKGMPPSLPQDLSWPCCCQDVQVSGTQICWESRAGRPGHGTYRREQQERKSEVMDWITFMLMWSRHLLYLEKCGEDMRGGKGGQDEGKEGAEASVEDGRPNVPECLDGPLVSRA